MSRFVFAFSLSVASTVVTGTASSEDFRIATTVYDLSTAKENGKPQTVSTSLSLFHHRKVYDYISSDGQVLIFDASAKEFTILSTSRSLATTVAFDEIKHLFKVGHNETENYINQQNQLGTTTAKQVAKAFQFQLNPKFEQSFDSNDSTLLLHSPIMTYKAMCSPKESKDVVKRYLDYADWIAKMNYILRPQATYPAARLELNKSLRKQNLFPTTVELRTRIEREIALRAKHSVSWELLARDRNLITLWEARLASDEVRKIPFRQYQEATLVTAGR